MLSLYQDSNEHIITLLHRSISAYILVIRLNRDILTWTMLWSITAKTRILITLYLETVPNKKIWTIWTRKKQYKRENFVVHQNSKLSRTLKISQNYYSNISKRDELFNLLASFCFINAKALQFPIKEVICKIDCVLFYFCWVIISPGNLEIRIQLDYIILSRFDG